MTIAKSSAPLWFRFPHRGADSVAMQPQKFLFPPILECSVKSLDEKDECSHYLDLHEFVGKVLRYAL